LMSEDNREMYGCDNADAINQMKAPGGVLSVLDREIAVHKSLRHPNIAGLLGTIQDTAYGVPFPLFCLQELGRGGTLRKMLYPPETCGDLRALPNDLTKRFTEEMLSALDYLHERGIMHRDVKPANILVDEQHQHLKLCDFGEAKQVVCAAAASDGGCQGMTLVGTPLYMAPEIQSGVYDDSVDVYAAGIIVMEMMGVGPVGNQRERHTILDRNATLLGNICNNGTFQSVAGRMWLVDPSSRPSAAEVLQSLPQTLMLFVKTVVGDAYLLEVEPTNTIAELKGMIPDEPGYLSSAQKLIFGGTELCDECTLDQYNIGQESTVHLVRQAVPEPTSYGPIKFEGTAHCKNNGRLLGNYTCMFTFDVTAGKCSGTIVFKHVQPRHSYNDTDWFWWVPEEGTWGRKGNSWRGQGPTRAELSRGGALSIVLKNKHGNDIRMSSVKR